MGSSTLVTLLSACSGGVSVCAESEGCHQSVYPRAARYDDYDDDGVVVVVIVLMMMMTMISSMREGTSYDRTTTKVQMDTTNELNRKSIGKPKLWDWQKCYEK